MSRDGRVIAKQPGTALSDDDEGGDNEVVIRSTMIKNYCIHVDLAVRSHIWPAQEVLLLEHRLREADFVNLARQSPIVPIGREILFGKALFAGYDGDFVTALHILVPQIEHMVRYHLKQAGAQTTNIDVNGIENENGLSSLMCFPQTEEIFGEDLSFEIKALFCDPFGPNLRNELAHGLLDDTACELTPRDLCLVVWVEARIQHLLECFTQRRRKKRTRRGVMSTVGERETRTQQRMVAFLQDVIDYLGGKQVLT